MVFELKLRSWIYTNFGTISAFADELGIKQTNISRYLNGSRKPGHDFFKKINKMGCDLNWLIGDEEETKKPFFKKFKSKNSLLLLFFTPFIEDNYINEIIIIIGL